ncbi:hypothetical protein BJ742DRAFT_224879 [Cladochytrium replicatum]|nr:hypothetical protein BJ742DRAFT_224879 [Cladochytrium replicatum]
MDSQQTPQSPHPTYEGETFQYAGGRWYTMRVKVQLREIFYLSAFAFMVSWTFIPFIGLCILRHTKVITYRSLMLTIWHQLAVMMLLVVHMALPAVQLFPCIFSFMSIIGWNQFFAVLIARVLRLMRMYQYQMWGIQVSNALRKVAEDSIQPGKDRILFPNQSVNAVFLPTVHTATDLEAAKVVLDNETVKPPHLTPPWFVRNRRWTSDSTINVCLLIWFCVWISYACLAAIFDPLLEFSVRPDENGVWYNISSYMVAGAFMVIIGPAFLWYLRRIEDTYKIKRELFVSILTLFPLYILLFIWDRFLKHVAPGLSVGTPLVLLITGTFSVQEADRQWSGSERTQGGSRSSRIMGNASESTRPSFTRAQSSVAPKPDTPESYNETPVMRLHGNKDIGQKGKVLGSMKVVRQPHQSAEVCGRDGFYQTLTDPECYQAFRKFAAQDFTVELCSFFEHYVHLAKKVLTSPDSEVVGSLGIIPNEMVNIASKQFSLPSASAPDSLRPSYILMKKLFFVSGSELELNIPSTMRSAVLAGVTNSNPISMNVFDATKNEVGLVYIKLMHISTLLIRLSICSSQILLRNGKRWKSCDV